MVSALALDSQLFAIELCHFIREIDPARWREDFEEQTRERAASLQAQLHRLHDSIEQLRDNMAASGEASVEQFEAAAKDMRLRFDDQIEELVRLFEVGIPTQSPRLSQMQNRWNEFRLQLVPTYELLAKNLRSHHLVVPNIRPSNYKRNIYHIANGLFALVVVALLPTQATIVAVAIGMATLAWSTEMSRRIWPRVNDFCMSLFRHVSHPHEAHRVNSATWYTTALVLLALTGDRLTISMALLVLALGDPFAAMVGRKYGRIQLVHGRTLEGTLAFVLVAVVATWIFVSLAHPSLSASIVLTLCLAASVPGAIAELLTRRLDDNLTVPLLSAVGVTIAQWCLGI